MADVWLINKVRVLLYRWINRKIATKIYSANIDSNMSMESWYSTYIEMHDLDILGESI